MTEKRSKSSFRRLQRERARQKQLLPQTAQLRAASPYCDYFDSALLTEFCTATEREILKSGELRGGKLSSLGTGYCLIDNGADILAVGHVDTARPQSNMRYRKIQDMVLSPALDDRLGIYTILDVLPKLGIKVDVLLTTGEEVCQSSGFEFRTSKQYRWIFSFDRRGTGVVLYDYGTGAVEFVKAVRKHFKIYIGSYSDIVFMEHLGCKALNVGTGYYQEHTDWSYALLNDWGEQVGRFEAFYRENCNVFYPHVEVGNRSRAVIIAGNIGAWTFDDEWNGEVCEGGGAYTVKDGKLTDALAGGGQGEYEQWCDKTGDDSGEQYYCLDCKTTFSPDGTLRNGVGGYYCPDCGSTETARIRDKVWR